MKNYKDHTSFFTVTFLFTFNHLPCLSEQQLVSVSLLQIQPKLQLCVYKKIKNISNISNSFFS